MRRVALFAVLLGLPFLVFGTVWAQDDEASETNKKKRRWFGRGSSAEQTLPVTGGQPLSRVHARLADTPLAADAEVRFYLDVIGSGEATVGQLASFAKLLAEEGYPFESLAHYEAAQRMAPKDADLWRNIGTVQRQLGRDGNAIGAYLKSLSLEPNHAGTHYNLGQAYRALNDYDRAVEAYLNALLLDPNLGDPMKNPQAVNNELLPAVQLLLYERRSAAGLPLTPIEADREPRR